MNFPDEQQLPGLTVLPSGLLAPSCDLPESARRVLSLAHSDGWQSVTSVDGVLCESKTVPWTCNKAARFTTTIQCTLTAFYAFLTSSEQLVKLDPLLAKFERLSTIEDTPVSLVYNSYNLFRGPIFGVSKRDFVVEVSNIFMQVTPEGLVRASARETVDEDPGSVLVQGSCSIGDDDRPPGRDAVRGVNFAFGYLARPSPSGIHVVQVMSMDPKGWIPAAAVDAGNRAQVDKLRALRRLLAST